MPKATPKNKKKRTTRLARLKSIWSDGSRWRKAWISLLIIVTLLVGGMYGMARYYIARHANEPIKLGVTFIPRYARSFDLDPKQTMTAMIDDLGFERFRLVSYWDDGEKRPGVYDFSELDWQFKLAEDRGVDISLAIGLRQPRWPECHMPKWASKMDREEWQPLLMDYIAAVVNRYKDSPALQSYQLENEFFLKAFGICPDHSRDRLVAEYNLVKSLDDNTPVVVSMSNNAIGTPIYDPTPDEWAISVYKRVWDKTITKRYFEYPIPAWYYAFRAGWTELTRGRDVFMHELQAEAWLPEGFQMNDPNDVDEMYKSMNAERLYDRFEYGRATGMKKIDLWGAEWWYWLKEKAGDDSLWQAAKQEIAKTRQHNEQLD